MESVEAIKRILKRERASRKNAELIIEEKSRELFALNEQLKSINESLEEQVADRTKELEHQNRLVKDKNEELQKLHNQLQNKLKELKEANKYKSEFLANMSHELRTPLNSILILARMLSENKMNNLTNKQVEYANIIQGSGQDLLSLINEILDLAKIEAGQVNIVLEEIPLFDIKMSLMDGFFEIAREHKIDLTIDIEDGLPNSIYSDKMKLMQILRNLLSNAFKFTEANGKVRVNINRLLPDAQRKCTKKKAKDCIQFSVIDSGIGIPKEKLSLIFEAFQQADGSTSRKYGGTGLGLSICRELTTLLGGGISVASEVNKGSTFSFMLPFHLESAMEEPEEMMGSDVVEEKNDTEITDDRYNLQPSDFVLLIIEDDVRFAKILKDFAHSKGFKTILTTRGDHGLKLTKKYLPTAVFLDIQLPFVDGWTVLKELKSNEDTAAIPVHIFSVVDKIQEGMDLGAVTYNIKPTKIEDLEKAFSLIKDHPFAETQCLLVCGASEEFPWYYQKLQSSFSNILYCENIPNAITTLRIERFQQIVIANKGLNVNLIPKLLDTVNEIETLTKKVNVSLISAHEDDFIQAKKNYPNLNFIKGTDNDLPPLQLQETPEPTVPKNQVSPKQKQDELKHKLKDKVILIVDDEMRNVFALDSLLEHYETQILIATNGKEALEKLQENPTVDLILMDIMMPILNGYEAIKAIRKMEAYQDLPILALTAKAMKGDRAKCIAVGASDYISKPINVDTFFSVLNQLL